MNEQFRIRAELKKQQWIEYKQELSQVIQNYESRCSKDDLFIMSHHNVHNGLRDDWEKTPFKDYNSDEDIEDWLN